MRETAPASAACLPPEKQVNFYLSMNQPFFERAAGELFFKPKERFPRVFLLFIPE